MSHPIEVHYWPTPNGWKVTILLEELGVPYDIVPVNIGKGEQFQPGFLQISPNNRMPAIVDHEPLGGGAPLAIFESGAILEYLAEKYGKFMPNDARGKYEVLQWLYWQMANLGPNSGQANHFRHYAAEKIEYGMKRYTDEVNRLYGVMNIRLANREFLAGDYSIADMASWPWIVPYERMGQDLNEFPHLKRWFDIMQARPAVQKGKAVGEELRQDLSEEAKKVLFGQRARK
ncbi:MAG: glutathione S-transferase N-terminal domain-containing protein [Deltaproteobacteria bacterium]|nr:glutathione S-transferase N-terminal domain-containing protein [Deltaproteobacteria bacterium]